MGQVQLESCHHNWSVNLLLELRSQVHHLTFGTIMLCNKPPQNSLAKYNNLYSMDL